MIGVDTNVLVRVFVDEAPEQTSAALHLLSGLSQDDPAFVSTIVLIELVWVLKRSYGFDDNATLVAVDSLLESANIEIEHAEMVQAAVSAAHEDGSDLADSLIALSAIAAGAGKVMTFDKNAAKRIAGMELLA
jgi:predicted nucleic-acid-binding protein